MTSEWPTRALIHVTWENSTLANASQVCLNGSRVTSDSDNFRLANILTVEDYNFFAEIQTFARTHVMIVDSL